MRSGCADILLYPLREHEFQYRSSCDRKLCLAAFRTRIDREISRDGFNDDTMSDLSTTVINIPSRSNTFAYFKFRVWLCFSSVARVTRASFYGYRIRNFLTTSASRRDVSFGEWYGKGIKEREIHEEFVSLVPLLDIFSLRSTQKLRRTPLSFRLFVISLKWLKKDVRSLFFFLSPPPRLFTVVTFCAVTIYLWERNNVLRDADWWSFSRRSAKRENAEQSLHIRAFSGKKGATKISANLKSLRKWVPATQ